jgi:hypothetical protein
VSATLQHSLDVAAISGLSGVRDVSMVNHRVECTVSGAMEPLLEALQPAVVLTLDSTEMNLDDVFPLALSA